MKLNPSWMAPMLVLSAMTLTSCANKAEKTAQEQAQEQAQEAQEAAAQAVREANRSLSEETRADLLALVIDAGHDATALTGRLADSYYKEKTDLLVQQMIDNNQSVQGFIDSISKHKATRGPRNNDLAFYDACAELGIRLPGQAYDLNTTGTVFLTDRHHTIQ